MLNELNISLMQELNEIVLEFLLVKLGYVEDLLSLLLRNLYVLL
jgi:hypothetical protein